MHQRNIDNHIYVRFYMWQRWNNLCMFQTNYLQFELLQSNAKVRCVISNMDISLKMFTISFNHRFDSN